MCCHDAFLSEDAFSSPTLDGAAAKGSARVRDSEKENQDEPTEMDAHTGTAHSQNPSLVSRLIL